MTSTRWTCIFIGLLSAMATAAPTTAPAYKLEVVPPPPGAQLEVGGLCWMPDGRLMACTRRGEIWSLKNGNWKRFASGLQEPLGLCPGDKDNDLYVTQRVEISHLIDSTNSGEADRYETLCDKFGFSGNYHEYCFGLVRDKEGSFWGTLNLAQTPDVWGGAYMGTGSKTLYRGWAFKVTAKGEFVPIASGLRSPNGIAISPEGDVFYADNQGEFVACGMLHHVTPGVFMGHPSSLIFHPEYKNLNPKNTSIGDLDKMRQPAAINFPYPAMGQSQSQPLFDTTGGKFGPFAGQMFIGDITVPVLMRCTLEKVDGEFQGACYPFMKNPDLLGLNRLLFAPDGTLYAGITDRGWGRGVSGLRKITFGGQVPFEIRNVSLTSDGFDVTFTKPIDPASASDPSAWTCSHFHYEYHKAYGSPEFDKTNVKPTKVEISPDKMHAMVSIPDLAPRRIYVINVSAIKDASGASVVNPTAYYTLNRLRK